MRITVCSATMNSAAPNTQLLLVWKDVPQLISVLLLPSRVPSPTSTGPSANSEKNLAKKAAPRRPPAIMQRLEISASGGESTRLTHT